MFVVVPLLVQLVAGELFALMGLALIMVLVALPGLRRVQDGRDGRAGKWGVRLTLVGLAAMVVLILSGDALDAMLDGTAQSIAEGAYLTLSAAAACGARRDRHVLDRDDPGEGPRRRAASGCSSGGWSWAW